jgi:hypothetical protein
MAMKPEEQFFPFLQSEGLNTRAGSFLRRKAENKLVKSGTQSRYKDVLVHNVPTLSTHGSNALESTGLYDAFTYGRIERPVESTHNKLFAF